MHFFKPARLWAAAVTIVILGAAVIVILRVNRKSHQQYVPMPKQVSEATCKLATLVPTAKTQSWKRYVNDKLCFSFLYPENATFDKANPGTPYEFLRIYDDDFDFTIEYPLPITQTVAAKSPQDVLSQLPSTLAQEFSGYKNIAGIQWVELTEHDKIADLKRYYTVRSQYIYKITAEDYGSMAVSNAILQTFQFGADGK